MISESRAVGITEVQTADGAIHYTGRLSEILPAAIERDTPMKSEWYGATMFLPCLFIDISLQRTKLVVSTAPDSLQLRAI